MRGELPFMNGFYTASTCVVYIASSFLLLMLVN